MKVKPAESLQGTIELPGDKSISHRAAIIAAIADGTSRLDNFAASADCTSTVDCLRSLGAEIRRDGSTVFIDGVGKFGLKKPEAPLDCGNSGTTMRLLSGILAGQRFKSVLTGDESLVKRPMRRIIEPLEQMGATIASDDGSAPLTIHGRYPLRAIAYHTPVASAQIKSCVLFAGLYANGETSTVEPTLTRDHTERLLPLFGVRVGTDGGPASKVRYIKGTSRPTAAELTIPCDISSAAFFLVAAACLPGSELTLPNVGTNPTRTAILDVLECVGAKLSPRKDALRRGEPADTLTISGGLDEQEAPLVIEGAAVADLIDEIPILAVLGTQLANGLEVRDAGELRVKESDRIHSVAENLRRMGASVTEFDDGFHVERSHLKCAVIDSFGDHRIAMAFAVAGLLADGETEIVGSECADVSFPRFFETLASVVKS
ncbi:MAG TPA: 3-phosphoshikimate 1-carboxyvinyltransferase [Pyrinomonadaceae bacterium]|nr:3-phosphoshikimate 1-carboxyvinyltransferase [Pyrinomonadaceae bacterium]